VTSGSPARQPGDLRARRHQRTRAEIVEAALDLFERRGYADVTMDDIAAAAGTSRRTLYRHFPTKDRILLAPHVDALATWDALVAQQPADAPSLTVAESAARAIAAAIDADAERWRSTWRIILSVPALEPAFLANPTWIARIVALLTDQARGPAVPAPVAHIVAGAYTGAIDAAMAHWAAGADDRTVAATVDAVLDHLRPIWPQRRRRS
jgi:AcrR family transcriptional regulator